MDTKSITKTLDIHATKEAVWKVLTNHSDVEEWNRAFMEGTKVIGEIKDGEQIIYLDPSGMGVAAQVTEFIPNKLLVISILAEITNGKADFNHPNSKRWEGTYDKFSLEEENEACALLLETSFPAEFYDDFVPGWNKMLDKIKALAENK
jgi:uncharacterized protein YndB with AHSA1/START domain